MLALEVVVRAAIPLMLAGMAFGWSIASAQRRARVHRLGGPLLLVLIALLVVGEVRNGLWNATGFHGPYFVLGIALTVGTLLLLVVRRRRVLGRVPQRILEALREDFFEDHDVRPWPAWATVAALLGVCALWCAVSLASGLLDNWLLFLNHRYLFLLDEASSQGSMWARMVSRVCADPLTTSPFGFLLAPFSTALDGVIPILLLRVGIGLMVVLLAVLTRLRTLGWQAVAGVLLLALMAPNPAYAFNRSAVFELFFAGLFLINLLMVLRLQRRPGYLLLLGFVMGLTLVHKETTLLIVVLCAWVLGRERAAPRDAGRLIGAWLAGLLLGMLPLFLEQLRCHTTEGMALVPYLGFRGAQLKSTLTQPMVQTLPVGVLPSGLGEIFLARLSFQTVGEIAVGAFTAMIPLVFTAAFPAPYLLVNGPRERAKRLGMLLVLCVPFYGLITWKGGDSAEALQLLLPFGFVYAFPYLIRLGRSWFATWHDGRWRQLRSLYLHALVALNVLWLAGMLLPVARVLSDLPRIVAWSQTRDDPGPAGPLIGVIEDLRRQGELDTALVCEGCRNHRSTTLLRLADTGLFTANVDVRYVVFYQLEHGNNKVLEQALRLIPHQQTMDMSLDGWRPPAFPRDREHLLVHRWSERMRSFLRQRADTLGKCIEVLFVDPAENLALLRLNRRPCLELATYDDVLPPDEERVEPPSQQPTSDRLP